MEIKAETIQHIHTQCAEKRNGEKFASFNTHIESKDSDLPRFCLDSFENCVMYAPAPYYSDIKSVALYLHNNSDYVWVWIVAVIIVEEEAKYREDKSANNWH